MSNAHWDPLREMEDLLERYGRVRSRGGHPAEARSEHISVADWRPVVDISESADTYFIEAEIAGTSREDVHVSVDDGVLTIQGHRDMPPETDGRKYHRAERARGRFARSFALPETADLEGVKANFQEGVLVVSIPKLRERRKRGIEIKVS